MIARFSRLETTPNPTRTGQCAPKGTGKPETTAETTYIAGGATTENEKRDTPHPSTDFHKLVGQSLETKPNQTT